MEQYILYNDFLITFWSWLLILIHLPTVKEFFIARAAVKVTSTDGEMLNKLILVTVAVLLFIYSEATSESHVFSLLHSMNA